jgi:hypothetical protein
MAMKNVDVIRYDTVLFALWNIFRHMLVLLRRLMDAAGQNEFVSLAHGFLRNNTF